MTHGMLGHRADFSTNKEGVNRVADDLNGLLFWTRVNGARPASLAIATAYFNPGGFNLLADELEQVGGARLLLGAEPIQGGDRLGVGALGDRRSRRGPDPAVTRALSGHARSLEEDRDLLGFNRAADAQARRLVTWLRDNPDNVKIRRYEAGFLHGKAFIVDKGLIGLIAGSSNFTYAGLAKNNELNIGRYEPAPVQQVIDWFDEQWDASVPYDLAALYEARWAPHQPWDVFLRMLHEMYGADLEAETDLSSRLGLTGFQADGVWRAKRILARRKGVLIADEVGLGKTFIAGELIHEAVFDRRQKVLIIAPATLRDATWLPFLIKNNLRADVLSFEQLVADIEDAGALTNRMQQLDEYAMVIVDEAHAMRNDKTQRADALRRVLAGNVPKDLVEMTATPVNNSLEDLYHLISYFAPGDAAFGDVGIPSLRKYFQRAIEMDPDALTPEHLFDVMDEVVVRRTRRFVKNHYAGDTVVINGVKQPIRFPTCRVKRVDYNLDAVVPGVFDDLATALGAKVSDEAMDASLAAGVIMEHPGEVLTMARYVPSQFLFSGNPEQYEAQNAGLLRSGLLKRFESSSYAFEQTVNKMITSHARFLDALDSGLVLTGDAFREWAGSSSDDVEDFFTTYDDPDGVADAADYDIEALHAAVTADRELLSSFATRVKDLHEGTDPKVEALIEELAAIAADATAEGIGPQDVRDKRKTLVFTYFADTASYLEGALRNAISTDPRLSGFSGRFTMVSGQDKADKADVIIGFSPMTAGTGVEEDKYDLIIATDVLAEGVNLQQARNIVNYDLPWNPMRLVQRSGRIDRIGSSHSEIFVRCFFPDADLDKILLLEERLKRKLKQAAAAVGHAEVLPGMDPVERVIADTREQIEQLRREEAVIFLDVGAGSLSGEDYRRRLANALKHPATKARVLALPWGSGTGFVREGATPGLVFCARIGGHPKPWFRYIPLNEDLSVAMTTGEEPHPFVIGDTLTCLTHADPQNDTVPANLPEPMFQAAFDAWAVAQEHIHGAWMIQTDPANLAPQIPKVLRDASAFVREHGGYLGETQDTLAARLNAPYPVRVQREVRRILLGVDVTEASKIDALNGLANRLGLAPPPSPPLLPPIELSDIHLVCWTAITPTPLGTESDPVVATLSGT